MDEADKCEFQVSDFKFLDVYGTGAFSEVRRVLNNKLNRYFAIKVVRFDIVDFQLIQMEVECFRTLKSEYIVKFYDALYVNNEVWIVLEYMNESVKSLVETAPMNEEAIAWVANQVLHGLKYLHGNGIMHRDIKSSNILVNEFGDVKLCDFGVSAYFTPKRMQNRVSGTLPFIAPEIIIDKSYNELCDIWSLGITCIEAAKGKAPYLDLDEHELCQKLKREYIPTLDGTFSDEFNKFVQKCLIRDPRNRPSAEDLLNDPFIKNANRNNMVAYFQETVLLRSEDHRNYIECVDGGTLTFVRGVASFRDRIDSVENVFNKLMDIKSYRGYNKDVIFLREKIYSLCKANNEVLSNFKRLLEEGLKKC